MEDKEFENKILTTIMAKQQELINDVFKIINEKYIEKSKIKEKMKKYEWALNDYDCSNADSKHSQCIGRYMALQELLKEE